jgi:hypothetical protein
MASHVCDPCKAKEIQKKIDSCEINFSIQTCNVSEGFQDDQTDDHNPATHIGISSLLQKKNVSGQT